jgi:hypothetical protein
VPRTLSYRLQSASHHLTATVILLAILALPFHFHVFTPIAQLSQECSCYQGARTYAVAVTAPAQWAPVLEALPMAYFEPQVLSRLALPFSSIRAPPSV